eukprot:TRINITY_DN31136_c0_g2_i1.p1 TRINITY_DN31136_c0_g2~~TRINITY_DN31136_c0_g2_i1.p1  ORF type:complete len:176 (+),score=14.49 TRINITY_DN31136_c0_g2_i1:65-592(+)
MGRQNGYPDARPPPRRVPHSPSQRQMPRSKSSRSPLGARVPESPRGQIDYVLRHVGAVSPSKKGYVPPAALGVLSFCRDSDDASQVGVSPSRNVNKKVLTGDQLDVFNRLCEAEKANSKTLRDATRKLEEADRRFRRQHEAQSPPIARTAGPPSREGPRYFSMPKRRVSPTRGRR